ncbi:MAG: carboxylating nicotinate-nucleotide diphosphorylase [Pseudomonadales bacterium]
MQNQNLLTEAIQENVRAALAEDVGAGDISASLIPANDTAKARVITRERTILCGQQWVDEIFRQLDASVTLHWQYEDGAEVEPDAILLELHGNTRSLLTGERSSLNFLQLLSGTTTLCASYAAKVAHTNVKLLDTRKTIPGLRLAQKYATQCGGCVNHRVGLYDAYLIKENHITACGSIKNAVRQARHNHPGKPVEVEVENFDELKQALSAACDRVMLDNFSLQELHKAVHHVDGRVELEASGGITDASLVPIAETGVDYISIGALTKDCKAIDLSMRIVG